MTAPLIAEAQAAERQGLRDQARTLYERALREHPDAAVDVSRWIGRTYAQDGELDAAADCAELSMTLAQLRGDARGVAHALILLGTVEHQRGDLDAAVARYRAARAQIPQDREPELLGLTEMNLGSIASIRGELAAALRHYQTSLVAFRAAGSEHFASHVLNNLGMLYTDLERWDDAEAALQEAQLGCIRMGDSPNQVFVQANLTALWLARRDYPGALRSCEVALGLIARTGDQRGLGIVQKHLGVVCREMERYDEAEEHFRLAAGLADERQDLLLAAETAREQADLFARVHRNRETLQSLNRAHRYFTRLRARRALRDIDQRLETLEGSFLEIVRRWGESIESKDMYTQGHCMRVASYACALARAYGMDERNLLWFRMGALLHDVGKIVVPSEILNKPGRFTPEERRIMESHAAAGVELLRDIEFPWDIRPMVRSHHEHWDGGGYPDGLRGEEIPLAARILCVADVYDALTTDRPYRRGFTREVALEIMARENGQTFDPALFALFRTLSPSELRDPTLEPPIEAAPPPPLPATVL